MSDIAIQIKGLKKQYRLGTIGGGSLSADLESWWARKRGKEDPNIQIGIDQTKIGDRFYALDGIDLCVKKGEVVGIIGGNGAGKSTLLKLISRVTAPTEGSIGINGRITSMLEVGTGFHPELTGRENIYMNGAILGMTKAEIDEKIEEIIDFSECRQFIDTPVKRYSSGMYVKLAFAVAAHLDSEIMILDEVLAVGDMKFQEKCLGKMGDESQEDGKTILYVSHNMSTIRQLCDRCIVLDHGRITYDGEVEKAISVYIDNQRGKEKTYFDFNDVSRPSIEHGICVFIESFCFVNKDKPTFYSDETAVLKVRWRANRNTSGIRFLFMIKNLEGNTIGFFQSNVICDAKENNNYETTIEMTLDNIMEGDYFTWVDIITLNEYGTHVGLDRPNEKVFFSIIRRTDYSGIIWNKNALGSVEFPMLKCCTRVIGS